MTYSRFLYIVFSITWAKSSSQFFNHFLSSVRLFVRLTVCTFLTFLTFFQDYCRFQPKSDKAYLGKEDLSLSKWTSTPSFKGVNIFKKNLFHRIQMVRKSVTCMEVSLSSVDSSLFKPWSLEIRLDQSCIGGVKFFS